MNTGSCSDGLIVRDNRGLIYRRFMCLLTHSRLCAQATTVHSVDNL